MTNPENGKKSKLANLLKDSNKDNKTKSTKPKELIGFDFNKNSNKSFNGLANSGNLCFSNVIVQCLVACKEFYTILNQLYDDLYKLNSEGSIETEFYVIYNLYKCLEYYKVKNTTLASQHSKTLAYNFDPTGKQNDAHEFLVFILDRCHEESISLKKKLPTNEDLSFNKMTLSEKKKTEDEGWEEVKKGGKRMKLTNNENLFVDSCFSKIFKGLLKHEINNKGKSVSNCNIEPFYALSLDFESSLSSSLEKYFSKKRVQDCNDMSLRTYLEKIPFVLIVQIKLFYYNHKSKSVEKNRRPVHYTPNLTIKEDWLSPSKSECKNSEYKLFSVIVHKGNYASEGHYVCYCLDEKNKWWNLNDKNVYGIEESQLLEMQPYLLLYRKIK